MANLSLVFNPVSGTFDYVDSGNSIWGGPVANYAALSSITTDPTWAVRVVENEASAYTWNGSSWIFLGLIKTANVGSSPNAQGYTLGTNNTLTLQPADASHPGVVANIGSANGVATLDGSGKIPVGQLPSVVMEYQGAWNPSTNTPTLSDGTGTNGNVYYVTAAFAGPVSGLTDSSMVNFQIGDLVIYSASVGKWQLVTPAAGVQSVNNAQGAVTVNAINQLTGDVTAGPASGSQSVSSTIANLAVTNAKIANSTIDLTSKVTGLLPIANGGTAASTTSQSFAFIGPTSGSGAPSFRALVAGDLPSLSSTYATTTLNNLGTTSINADLIPSADQTRTFGASSKGWLNGYINTLKDSSGQDSVRPYNRTLRDSTSSTLLDWGSLSSTVLMQHKMALNNAANTTQVTMSVNTGGTSYSILWPSSQGTGPLTNDGSGNLTWTAVSLSSGVSGVLPSANGGSGVNNGGTFTWGSNNITFTTSGTTSLILPTSGTVAVAGTGDIASTNAAISNNQSTPANVAGLSFSSSVHGAKVLYSIIINATSSLYETGELLIANIGNVSWQMTQTSTGNASNVILSITSSGQVQYTTPSYTGFSSGTIYFRAQGI